VPIALRWSSEQRTHKRSQRTAVALTELRGTPVAHRTPACPIRGVGHGLRRSGGLVPPLAFALPRHPRKKLSSHRSGDVRSAAFLDNNAMLLEGRATAARVACPRLRAGDREPCYRSDVPSAREEIPNARRISQQWTTRFPPSPLNGFEATQFSAL